MNKKAIGCFLAVFMLLAVSLASAVSTYTVKSSVNKNIGCTFTDILTEGFEGGVMPPSSGWYTVDGNTVDPWIIVDAATDPELVHSGDYSGYIAWDDVNPSDNWLVSPDVDLSGYSEVTLDFWCLSDTDFPGATVKLHIKGNGFDDVIWDMIRDENWGPFVYRPKTFDLSSYIGGTIDISWQYVGIDGNGFGLDDIIVSGTSGGGNNPPYEPNTPNPIDGAINVSINADLSWIGGDPDSGDTVTYDVYFDTSSPPPKVTNNQTDNTYDPSAMNMNTTYYWKIVAWDDQGESAEGQIWCFTTASIPNEPPTPPIIRGTTFGRKGGWFRNTFYSTDPDGNDIYYYVEYSRENMPRRWYGPVSSGYTLWIDGGCPETGFYSIKAKAKDIYGAESNWTTLPATIMPVNQQQSSQSIHQQNIGNFMCYNLRNNI